MPNLTILMPVYNGRETIARAVRSTLRAMPCDAELLIIDDGSSDGTVGVLERLHQPRLRVLENDGNLGVAASLQRGLNSSSSRYVARMDADDICLPWRFELSLRALKAKYDAVFTGVVHFGTGVVRPTEPTTLRSRAFNLTLLMENPFPHPTFTAKRSHVEKSGGYRHVLAEDYDLWLRMAIAGSRMARLAAPTVLYRHHPSQVTRIEHWRQRALTEPAFVDAYREFVRELFDVDPIWYDDLVAQRDGEGMSRLEALIECEAAVEGLRVRRNLRRRLGHVSKRRSSSWR
ncbi:glycosyltransferase [Microbacterium sp. KSW4-11]|uniref:Glycosyltransferase n=1 Tax=Microbacterium gawkjiense TaxID=3067309 RepID=A0ABU3GA87_9MICO|nr:glycosyltransferase [Microbacterium sp. KSW4-11]MDT3316723.1 glycosyltransferase [Microbacterium sp. KSW4-11]